jgi:hypothetical protein
MRKGALLLLAFVFALAATTSADAGRAKRAAAKPAPDPAIEAQKNSAAFIADLFRPWAPQATMKEPAKPKAKKKKKG